MEYASTNSDNALNKSCVEDCASIGNGYANTDDGYYFHECYKLKNIAEYIVYLFSLTLVLVQQNHCQDTVTIVRCYP